MNILGISAYYHDSAAAVVRDGNIVAAAQEERFTRKKHDTGFPSHAVSYCLGCPNALMAKEATSVINSTPINILRASKPVNKRGEQVA